MKKTVELLKEYAEDGIIPLSLVKIKNYRLYKLTLSNFNTLQAELKEQGIYLLDDSKTPNSLEGIFALLRIRYGDTINLSELKVEDRTLYDKLVRLGNPKQNLISAGFRVKYARKRTEADILEEIQPLIENGVVKFSQNDRKVYYHVYRLAQSKGMTVFEYFQSIGLSYKPANIVQDRAELYILYLKHESYEKAAKEAGVAPSTVWKAVKEMTGGGKRRRSICRKPEMD